MFDGEVTPHDYLVESWPCELRNRLTKAIRQAQRRPGLAHLELPSDLYQW